MDEDDAREVRRRDLQYGDLLNAGASSHLLERLAYELGVLLRAIAKRRSRQ